MVEIEQLRLAILSWARINGILSDNVPIEQDGSLDLVPFEPEAIEYFRTRKIVRVEVDEKRVTIFSRLPIAKTKQSAVKSSFSKVYGKEKIELYIDASKPYKVDQALQTYKKFEPLRKHNNAISCGSSVGLGNQRNAGTLTALAKNEEGELFGLSCNHVVGGCSIAQPGTPVVSPGIQDVSVENNEIHVIGDYFRPAPMSQGLPSVIPVGRNRDLACFTIRDRKVVTSLQGVGEKSYDTPLGFATAKHGLPVKKWGRSTGYTEGEISFVGKYKRPEPVDYNVICFYGPMNSQVFKGTVYFDEVYEVSSYGAPFSLGGDSGSLVVTNYDNKTQKVIGIVIAGDKLKSVVLPLKPALKDLKLKLVAGLNV